MNYSYGLINGYWYVFTNGQILNLPSGGGFKTEQEAINYIAKLTNR